MQNRRNNDEPKVKVATASSALPFGGLVILLVIVLLIGATSGM